MSDGARVTRNFTLTGTWTPVVTFATPGDLSVAYSTQVGRYVKIGSLVWIVANVILSTFTHTTASGSLTLTGLPFTSLNVAGTIAWLSTLLDRYTKANYTQVTAYVPVNGTSIRLYTTGSGQAPADISTGDLPSATTFSLYVAGSYQA